MNTFTFITLNFSAGFLVSYLGKYLIQFIGMPLITNINLYGLLFSTAALFVMLKEILNKKYQFNA